MVSTLRCNGGGVTHCAKALQIFPFPSQSPRTRPALENVAKIEMLSEGAHHAWLGTQLQNQR